MAPNTGITNTIGAILAGAFICIALSAIVGFQTFLYFQVFHSDQLRYKMTVAWIWALDTVHTVLIGTIVWQFAIANFGNSAITNTIFATVPATVVITGLTTLSANIFYGWRLHKLSKRNWWISGPIACLSLARMALSIVNAMEMIIEKSFSNFSARIKSLVTGALIISAVTDLLVSAARYYYLRRLKEGYLMSQEVLDSIVIFTVNDGGITCAVALATTACWLVMPGNFIWLAIYFTLVKFYSNSVLSTLNLRNWYRHRPVHVTNIPLKSRLTSGPSTAHVPSNSTDGKRVASIDDGIPSRMEVFIDHQVEYVGDLGQNGKDEDGQSHSSQKSVDIS
ncbi:hypothetical protein FB45DRAFT_458029 [Roridomyces roridus]|uniref:DUF6534 domain-containing protein n=1 Tax=Roridomyces roridus TaxID=1738132 RepID=A0AAD7C2N6_9AGAR|nr:hypothetical protein FB45DRAFT_458029 [Roridomyces roridus]